MQKAAVPKGGALSRAAPLRTMGLVVPSPKRKGTGDRQPPARRAQPRKGRSSAPHRPRGPRLGRMGPVVPHPAGQSGAPTSSHRVPWSLLHTDSTSRAPPAASPNIPAGAKRAPAGPARRPPPGSVGRPAAVAVATGSHPPALRRRSMSSSASAASANSAAPSGDAAARCRTGASSRLPPPRLQLADLKPR